MKTILKIIPETIADPSHVILVTHVNPDGEAPGSLLGFADILQGLGKKVFAYPEEHVSSMYDFLSTLYYC